MKRSRFSVPRILIRTKLTRCRSLVASPRATPKVKSRLFHLVPVISLKLLPSRRRSDLFSKPGTLLFLVLKCFSPGTRRLKFMVVPVKLFRRVILFTLTLFVSVQRAAVIKFSVPLWRRRIHVSGET